MATSARIEELQKKFAENPRRYFAPLANEFRKAGDLQQAILICEEYLPQQPGHMSGHIVYGQVLFESGRLDEARAVFETALSLDPENLIALRHLGDIARRAGDVDAARGWYRRVLETDPRNDEIADVLATLDAAPAVAAVTAESPQPQSAWSMADSTAEATASDEVPPIPEIPEAMAGTSESLEAPMERVMASAATEAEAPEPAIEVAGLHDEEPDRVEIPPPEMTHAAVPPVALDMPVAEADREAMYEPATDAAPRPAPEAVPEAAVVPTEAFDLSRIEREGDYTFEPAVGAHVDELHAALESTVVSEAPALAESGDVSESLPSLELSTVESAPIDGGHDGQEVPPAASEMFVTETMAELYFRQGHLELALDTYRRLLDQRPSDAHLRERLRAVEETLYGAPPPLPEPTPPLRPAARQPELALQSDLDTSVAASAEARFEKDIRAGASAATARPMAGPTIREFLLGLFPRAAETDQSATAGADAAVEQSSSPSWDEQQVEFGAPTPPVEASLAQFDGPTPAATDDASLHPSSDPLATMFERAETPGSDVDAAVVLAGAFASEPLDADDASLDGVPAHYAATELSLDHLFRHDTPAKSADAGSGFSFDRFFAEDVTEESTTSRAAGEPAPNTTPHYDIAQFNAWLNGLKKT